MLLLVLLTCFPVKQTLSETLLCPPGVTTFSTGPSEESYYVCEQEGSTPVRATCPPHHYYWPVKESCHPNPDTYIMFGGQKGVQDLHEYTAPVLGRPVMLGSLMDATRNQIYPATSLWSRDTVTKSKLTTTSYSSNVDFFAAQTTYQRMSHMDMEASLKLDFLGGLIHVEGSAGYLKDSVESEKTLAYMMKGHYLTRSEILPTTTPLDYSKPCAMKGVTHVVTAITYGMDAYFAFKKTVNLHESKERIQGDLKISVNSIPTIKIDGHGKVVINGSLKKMIEGIDVKLRGDFVLRKQPTTYVESVLVFANLTSQLGKPPNYKRASKMKMVLSPITMFCDKSTAILSSISDALLQSVTKMLDEIERSKLKAKTLEMTDAVRNYIPLQQIMNIYSDKLSVFELQIKAKLQMILPKIRGKVSGSSEADLVDLLTKYRFSPFDYSTSRIFLMTRQREIESVDFILDPAKFKGTQVDVVSYEEAGDVKTLYTHEKVLWMNFNVLPNTTVVERFLEGKPLDESSSWFNNKTLIAEMGKTFKSFMAFAAANEQSKKQGFLFGVYDKKKDIMNIYAQKENTKLTEHFDTPDAPPIMTIVTNEYNAVTFHVERSHNKWVTGIILRYWTYGKQSEVTITKYLLSKTNLYAAGGLLANNFYFLVVSYDTAMGEGPRSRVAVPLVTKPCSQPSNVRVSKISSTTIFLQWNAPEHIGKGVDYIDYIINVTKDAAFIQTRKSGGLQNITLQHLDVAMQYDISVQAMASVQKGNTSKGTDESSSASAKAWINATTSPDSPSTPRLISISYHSAELEWSAPARVAAGGFIREYFVKYCLLNNMGNESIAGKSMVRSATNRTCINITDLIQGSTYGVSVQVITSLGASAYSPVLIVKTRFIETDLDRLRHSMEEEIKIKLASATKKIEKNENKLRHLIYEIKQSVSDATKKLHSEIDDETKRTGNINSTLTRDIANLKSKQNKIARNVEGFKDKTESKMSLFHPRSMKGLIYIGHGYAYSRTKIAKQWGISFDACVNKCLHLRKIEGPSWDGLVYNKPGAEYCGCNQRSTGYVPHPDYIYYRFVSDGEL